MSRQGLSPEALELAFPFYFIANRELHLTQMGARLSSLCERIVVGARLSDAFDIERPLINLSFEALEKHQSQVVLFGLRSRRREETRPSLTF